MVAILDLVVIIQPHLFFVPFSADLTCRARTAAFFVLVTAAVELLTGTTKTTAMTATALVRPATIYDC